ncbi:MAG TPA: DUF4831 family protein [Bacteroides sp.]|nr:DUF4831 family protein [Bacteroides sp.]
MRKTVGLIALVMLLPGCATSTRVRVMPLGMEPEDKGKEYFYALPRTVLKVEVTCLETKQVPGPYWEYADKLLGIKEVIRQPSAGWEIVDVHISGHREADPGHLYTIHLLEGELRQEALQRFMEKGVLLDGTEMVEESIAGPGLASGWESNHSGYVDLGVEGNFEERKETMYKTLVTDTSFVSVPVDRTIVEQKTVARKAEEAAEFILQIRTSRFEMLTGLYEVFPQGEAMAAAIDRLDRLEESYLSLFTGKNLRKVHRRSYFLVPESGSSPAEYRLGMFSGLLGFVPEGLMEGVPLVIRMTPQGKGAASGTALSAAPVAYDDNLLYYRIPDVAEMKVILGDQILKEQRISIFQAGSYVTYPID